MWLLFCAFVGGGFLKIPWKSSSFWSLRLLNHPDRLLLVMQFFENRTEMNFLQINYTIRRLNSCLRAFYQSHRSAVILLTVTLFSRLLFWFPSNVTHVGLSLISPSSDSSSWYHHHQNCKLIELCLLLMRSLRGVLFLKVIILPVLSHQKLLCFLVTNNILCFYLLQCQFQFVCEAILRVYKEKQERAAAP